ncbi:class E sortase [Streptomyces sp. NBC_01351]|uniref:class E sortase n=1 Tax=Streptomyces sp. NBC_01351 TaxID=2903833 RepID=UPI002E31B423|nr:class E sortase [Streptomyces sp. NBC_01351]
MPLPLPPRAVSAVLAGAVTALLAACAPEAAAGSSAPPPHTTAAPPATAPAPPPVRSVSPVTAPATTPASPAATATPTAAPSTRSVDPGHTRVSTLSIPSAGVSGLRVVPYEGTTDDVPGTRIQDRGDAASPYGERGGTGPGQVGNFLVTAHRLSAGGPLRDLPAVAVGDTVLVTVDGTTYTYEITATRTTSFRSERSLNEQRAAVPGAPGVAPTRAMITISTCATPEDHAAGNFWSDAQGNPEHRIDKIGVLRDTAPAPAG